MSDLLQDIDEALRRERAEKFWRENGSSLIGGVVLLVVLTGVFAAWNNWQAKGDARQTRLLVSALDTAFPETALDAAAQTLTGEHKAIAGLQAAGLQAQKGNSEGALALYNTVANDSGAPDLWRDLAVLMAARLEWDATPTADTARTLGARLKPLLAKGNPWRLHALVDAAMLAGDGLGDYKGALSLLAIALESQQAPKTLRERATALDHLYALRLSQTKDAPQADTAAQTESKG